MITLIDTLAGGIGGALIAEPVADLLDNISWLAPYAETVALIGVVIIITAAQLAVTYLPPLQVVLGTEAVPLADGLLILAVGAAFFAIIESEKQIRLGLKGQRNSAA